MGLVKVNWVYFGLLEGMIGIFSISIPTSDMMSFDVMVLSIVVKNE